MSFHAPEMFYWLFLLVPFVLIWHFLKLRRQAYHVSSLQLWMDIARDARANIPFQWFHRSLPLVLQLGIILLGITALARPIQQGAAEENYCIILQNSASMQVRLDGKTRWDEAISKINTWLDALDEGTRVSFIEAGRHPRLYTSQSHVQLRQQLANLTPKDAPCNLEAAIRLAQSLGNPRILLFGTHLPDSMEVDLAFYPATKNSANVAITRVDVTHDSEILVNIQNLSPIQEGSGPGKRVAPVYLEVDGERLESDYLDLLPGEKRLIEFKSPEVVAETVARIKIETTDALAIDNIAYVVLYPQRPLPVHVVSTRFHPYLQKLLQTAPLIRAVFIPEETYVPGNTLAIFHGVEVPADAPDRFIRILSSEPDSSISVTILGGLATHPLLQGIDLDFWVGQTIQAALTQVPPKDALSILESDKGPLLWVEEVSGQRSVIFGWDLLEPSVSEFARSYAGWLLVVNAIEWLREQPVPVQPVPAGEDVIIHPPPGITQITVQMPDGSIKPYPVENAGIVFDETDHVGIYVVSAENWNTSFAVNLLNEQESNLDKQQLSVAQRSERIDVSTTPKALWHWFLLMAIGLTVIEWWTDHRSE